jgi:hypothetical protein
MDRLIGGVVSLCGGFAMAQHSSYTASGPFGPVSRHFLKIKEGFHPRQQHPPMVYTTRHVHPSTGSLYST